MKMSRLTLVLFVVFAFIASGRAFADMDKAAKDAASEMAATAQSAEMKHDGEMKKKADEAKVKAEKAKKEAKEKAEKKKKEAEAKAKKDKEKAEKAMKEKKAKADKEAKAMAKKAEQPKGWEKGQEKGFEEGKPKGLWGKVKGVFGGGDE